MNLEFDCPRCGAALNDSRSTHVTGEPPSPGDLNICGKCGCLSEFVEGGLRIMSVEDLEKLDPEERKHIDFAIRCIKDMADRIERNKNETTKD